MAHRWRGEGQGNSAVRQGDAPRVMDPRSGCAGRYRGAVSGRTGPAARVGGGQPSFLGMTMLIGDNSSGGPWTSAVQGPK